MARDLLAYYFRRDCNMVTNVNPERGFDVPLFVKGSMAQGVSWVRVPPR